MTRIDNGKATSGLELLDDANGELPPDIFRVLLARRDDRRVVLKE